MEGEGRAAVAFDPMGRKHGRAVDHAVAQEKDGEAAEIPERNARAAAADLLAAFGFQRIEGVEFHAEP